MSTFPIPDDVLARHIAVVGETGSGKTFDTKSIVEHLVAEGNRVCVLDTIKSDWWGIISSTTGKRPGLPFRIIGGPRGHVPLHAGAGRPIGELVAKGKLPLSIIDMADFDAGEPQRFFEDFAKALWKNTKGVVYLVIEEAHEIAPKERAGFGKENMAVYWAKKLATGSRTKGIRLIVATQRTQALHNAVLGSCGALAAHSLSLPADQKPVIDWLDANLRDKALFKSIKEELAFLPTGTAWVCCAKTGFFQKVHFPPIKTFDNTATPDKDATEFDVATAAVDPEELRAIIGDAVKEAEANDPVALKAEVRRLTAMLAKADSHLMAHVGVKTGPSKSDEKALAAQWQAGQESIRAMIPAMLDAQHEQSFTMGADWGRGAAILAAKAIPNPDGPIPARRVTQEIKTLLSQHAPPGVLAVTKTRPASSPPPPASKTPRPPSMATNGTITASQATFLRALAWWKEMGHPRPTRAQVAALAGWRVTAGHLKNVAGALRSSGLIEYPDPGHITLTEAGLNAAPEPDMGATLLEGLRATLSTSQRTVLDALLRHRRQSRAELSEQVGWDASAGHLKNILGTMRSMQIIDYPASGEVELQEWVQ